MDNDRKQTVLMKLAAPDARLEYEQGTDPFLHSVLRRRRQTSRKAHKAHLGHLSQWLDAGNKSHQAWKKRVKKTGKGGVSDKSFAEKWYSTKKEYARKQLDKQHKTRKAANKSSTALRLQIDRQRSGAVKRVGGLKKGERPSTLQRAAYRLQRAAHQLTSGSTGRQVRRKGKEKRYDPYLEKQRSRAARSGASSIKKQTAAIMSGSLKGTKSNTKNLGLQIKRVKQLSGRRAKIESGQIRKGRGLQRGTRPSKLQRAAYELVR